MNEISKEFYIRKENLEDFRKEIKNSLTLGWDFKMPNGTYVLNISGAVTDINKLNEYYQNIKN